MNANITSLGIPGESRPREAYYAIRCEPWRKLVTDPVEFIEDFLRDVEQHQLQCAARPMVRVKYRFDGGYFMVSKEDDDQLIAVIAIVDEAPEVYSGLRLSGCEYLMTLIDEFNKELCEHLLRPCAENAGIHQTWGFSPRGGAGAPA